MSKLVDMKQGKKEKKEAMTVPARSEEYPYGLVISLNQEQIKKIKGAENLNAGDNVHIVAQGTVKEKSVNDSEGEGKRHRAEIQIKKISLSRKETKKGVGDILYGGKRNLK